MIPKTAITNYLNRDLDNHIWVKQLSAAQLDAALSQLRPRPQLHPKLRSHQKACFLLGVAHQCFCYWLDMGVGKSLLSLELLRYWWQCGVVRRAVIFVTSDKAFATWEKQLAEFDIGLPMTALQGSSVQKWQQLEDFGDGLVLLPYPGAVAMTTQRVKVKKGKYKLQLDPTLVEKLGHWAQAIVLDESTKCGHQSSLTHQLVDQLRAFASIRYALAGRPFGRDPTMLWTQHFLIDDGATLGETLGLFRAAFFKSKKNRWGRGRYTTDYIFNNKMRPQLSRLIQHRSLTYSADECIDLPKVIPIREVVKIPEESEVYYKRVIEEIIEAKGNMREIKNAFLRMRQISSGFVGLKDDETGATAEVEFLQNPKLDRLIELIEGLPEGRKGVVFYEFTFSARKIVEQLKALGIGYSWLWSGTKNSTAEFNRFLDKPSCEIAVIQSRVGAYSLDGLQKVANYTFFYESPLSVIDREQAERRLIRQGQKRHVFQYDLLTANTVDERILAYHAEGRSLAEALLRNPAKALGLSNRKR